MLTITASVGVATYVVLPPTLNQSENKLLTLKQALHRKSEHARITVKKKKALECRMRYGWRNRNIMSEKKLPNATVIKPMLTCVHVCLSIHVYACKSMFFSAQTSRQ